MNLTALTNRDHEFVSLSHSSKGNITSSMSVSDNKTPMGVFPLHFLERGSSLLPVRQHDETCCVILVLFQLLQPQCSDHHFVACSMCNRHDCLPRHFLLCSYQEFGMQMINYVMFGLSGGGGGGGLDAAFFWMCPLYLLMCSLLSLSLLMLM